MKTLFAIALAATATGCATTQETREVTVHKDPTGKVLSIDYIERLEQRDIKPWQDGFGKYLYKQ